MSSKNLTTRVTIQNLTAQIKANFAKKTELPTKVSDLTNDSNFQTGEQVSSAISAALVGALKPSGSVAFENLPALAAAVLNRMYNITDAFTTTSDFLEGSGKDYPAGTNVAIINIGTDDSPIYKYDVYTGIFDFSGFATKVTSATSGNFAGLDANGNPTDSGKAPDDFALRDKDAVTGNVAKFDSNGDPVDSGLAYGDIATKVTSATSGNFAGLDANGNLTDSGKKAADFVERVFVNDVEDPVLHESDISDYTAQEIAALLADSE